MVEELERLLVRQAAFLDIRSKATGESPVALYTDHSNSGETLEPKSWITVTVTLPHTYYSNVIFVLPK